MELPLKEGEKQLLQVFGQGIWPETGDTAFIALSCSGGAPSIDRSWFMFPLAPLQCLPNSGQSWLALFAFPNAGRPAVSQFPGCPSQDGGCDSHFL